MWDIIKFMIKAVIVIAIISAIYNGIYSLVDPQGYQASVERAQKEREREEIMEKAVAEAKKAEKANAWCEEPNYDTYVKTFNTRHPDHPLVKNNIDESYGTVTIMFNGYNVFYKEYEADDGDQAGKGGKIISVQHEFADSKKVLSENDKKTIKAAFGLSEEELNEMVEKFNAGSDSAVINNKKYSFSGNDGGMIAFWQIRYDSLAY